ncbi:MULTISPECIES: ArsI/CadI family heavy metal resistance metalloenzyme [unclassified Thioalkalivibrio]|uniref:ArsI/CadI family heavy metal resistance metalloenzyme n=1 Tax=unclassified Thioalkalivibrio TaxID=2621013 RepID=UPI00036703D6|nr:MULTISPECIES: ArsI/CadI family heavy metal resistance metalloenzyme [unclassified Thioalkalivibrio]
MKRMHLHVSVPELEPAIRFYSHLFAAEPSVVKGDYAKWMLEDPRVNFAVSARGAPVGLNHLGIQAEEAGELDELGQRLDAIDADVREEMGTHCCYAQSDKYWTTDPAGIAWESYQTLGSIPMFGAQDEGTGDCCVPEGTSTFSCGPASDNEAKGCC